MADWDERYARGEHASDEPHRLLSHVALEHFRPGRALDLASGAGRNALFLASLGWRVVAVDASRVGVELTQQRARERGVEVETHVADLERGEFKIEPEAFDLACDFYYLQRDLFPALRACVRRGGAFVAAIHLDGGDAAATHARPSNPDFLLRPGELLAEFRGWKILHYHETSTTDDDAARHNRRTAELIAQKP
ncbi:MAG TPA: methyltransferase domain-containing protein [Pyrinomonadaceae bacterium]|nr:methyltransferase domain-containing protein [Pyrinomonadaceae bacterium]